MKLFFSTEVLNAFKGLCVFLLEFSGVSQGRQSHELDVFVESAVEDVRRTFRLETLPQNPLVRAYRGFFWSIGIDPTKTRPSAEALLRRVLQGKAFPRVNTLVDVYNVVSMKQVVPIAALDIDKISGTLMMRFAREGEAFQGIGMDKPHTLSGRELVVQDDEKLVAVYPYRDAETTKVSEHSRNVLFMVCGVPEVETSYLEETSSILAEAVKKFSGGVCISKELSCAGGGI
ncbi:MAG: phenylalanine--tRNA ligase beta subunit-related protein [Candidatus Caldarchaeum sp.]